MKISWADLFTLIHGMTAAEKGYFKKYNSGYTGAGKVQYAKLFDAIAGMKTPDAAFLEKRFSHNTKNIYSLRSFLQKQILKSLRMYHVESDVSFTLRDALDNIAILNAKGMHKQCIDIIEKGLAISQTYGMTNYTILFLTEKRQQLKYYAEAKRNIHANEIRQGLIQQAKTIINKEIIKEAHLKSIHWLNTYVPLRDEKIRTEAETLYLQLKEISEDGLKEYNEKNLWFAALSNICAMLDKTEESITYQQQSIELMDQIDVRKINRVLNYAAAIFNICNLTLGARDTQRSAFWIHKLRRIETANDSETIYIDSLAVYLEFYLHSIRDTGYDAAIVEAVESFLLKEHPIPNVFYDTQLLLLNYYIRHKHYSEALIKSNSILNSDYVHSQSVYLLHVRLLNILVHYKMGNLILLPSLIRSTYRFMRKLNIQFPVEALILKFFSRLLSQPASSDIREQFTKLSTELEIILKNKSERKVMETYFDYYAWLKGELEG